MTRWILSDMMGTCIVEDYKESYQIFRKWYGQLTVHSNNNDYFTCSYQQKMNGQQVAVTDLPLHHLVKHNRLTAKAHHRYLWAHEQHRLILQSIKIIEDFYYEIIYEP